MSRSHTPSEDTPAARRRRRGDEIVRNVTRTVGVAAIGATAAITGVVTTAHATSKASTVVSAAAPAGTVTTSAAKAASAAAAASTAVAPAASTAQPVATSGGS